MGCYCRKWRGGVMMRKTLVLIGVLLTGVGVSQVISRTVTPQSGRPNPVQAAPNQPSQTAAAAGQTWEYRILSSYLPNGLRMTLEEFERKVNKAASQGFEVQSLESTQQQAGPYQAPPIFPDLIVLLRRPRK